MRYRSRIDIVEDILQIAQGGANKTKIMYNAFLSFAQSKEYLQLLIDSGLLEFSEGKYTTTEKGVYLLKMCEEIKNIMAVEKRTLMH